MVEGGKGGFSGTAMGLYNKLTSVDGFMSIHLSISPTHSLYIPRYGGDIIVFLLFMLSLCEKRVGSWQRRNVFLRQQTLS